MYGSVLITQDERAMTEKCGEIFLEDVGFLLGRILADPGLGSDDKMVCNFIEKFFLMCYSRLFLSPYNFICLRQFELYLYMNLTCPNKFVK